MLSVKTTALELFPLGQAVSFFPGTMLTTLKEAKAVLHCRIAFCFHRHSIIDIVPWLIIHFCAQDKPYTFGSKKKDKQLRNIISPFLLYYKIITQDNSTFFTRILSQIARPNRWKSKVNLMLVTFNIFTMTQQATWKHKSIHHLKVQEWECCIFFWFLIYLYDYTLCKPQTISKVKLPKTFLLLN